MIWDWQLDTPSTRFRAFVRTWLPVTQIGGREMGSGDVDLRATRKGFVASIRNRTMTCQEPEILRASGYRECSHKAYDLHQSHVGRPWLANRRPRHGLESQATPAVAGQQLPKDRPAQEEGALLAPGDKHQYTTALKAQRMSLIAS
jgi:hypothetical protein